MQHVFIVGCKGVPASYGGYESFVDKLTEYHQDNTEIQYHVACKNSYKNEFIYHNARCFNIKVPNIGSPQAIYYDIMAVLNCCKYIKQHKIEHPIIYVLACRIGPFAHYLKRKIHKLGGQFFVNPDGHEWLRAKWSYPVRMYWKLSERLMVKHADLMICDSKHIEQYIQEEYAHYQPNTTFIAYGAETRKSNLADDDAKIVDWYRNKGVSPNEYYLVVGRFVPENNYETMIREFMQSNSTKDFVLITNVNEGFLHELKKKTGLEHDPRIKFVGTVYDQELLMKIRENAFAYLHGHEVGGTNPSLLEALSSTSLNLLLDVGFNREVAEDGALYWSKEQGSLAALIKHAEALTAEELLALEKTAMEQIVAVYNWASVGDKYCLLFANRNRLSEKKNENFTLLVGVPTI